MWATKLIPDGAVVVSDFDGTTWSKFLQRGDGLPHVLLLSGREGDVPPVYRVWFG